MCLAMIHFCKRRSMVPSDMNARIAESTASTLFEPLGSAAA